jgi:hypothetical protein
MTEKRLKKQEGKLQLFCFILYIFERFSTAIKILDFFETFDSELGMIVILKFLN